MANDFDTGAHMLGLVSRRGYNSAFPRATTMAKVQKSNTVTANQNNPQYSSGSAAAVMSSAQSAFPGHPSAAPQSWVKLQHVSPTAAPQQFVTKMAAFQ